MAKESVIIFAFTAFKNTDFLAENLDKSAIF
jgi:hypothetical protein